MRRFALVWIFVSCGCNPVDVDVADLIGPDGGHFQPGKPCNTTEGDCLGNDFCEKDDCSSALGKCRPRPRFCQPEPSPVCGCNGVNYWNNCERERDGISAALSGECADPAPCSSCPTAACAVLLVNSNTCAAPPSGVCWVVPPTCPNLGAPLDWKSCSGTNDCVDFCVAIRSGQPRLHGSCP